MERPGAMTRGRRLASQLVQGSFSLSNGVRSSHSRGSGSYISTGELLRSEARHMCEHDVGIRTRLVGRRASHRNEGNFLNRIPNLMSYCDDGVRVMDISNKHRYLDYSNRQWFEFQKRAMSSSEQAVKTSDNQEVKTADVSQSNDSVGLKQPPLSQPLEGTLMPTSEEEEMIAPILSRPDLLVTRNVEWANLALGFEQQNKYLIVDPREPEVPVGYIVEKSNVLLRQVMRTRRPFVVSLLNANGEEVCQVRRPAFLINSSIFVEVNGKVIGECHRRWHLWKRIYDVYIGNKQFATVENPGFWNWNFTLMDDRGGVLAEIDRSWRGFGYEFLTDAGQYVIRFGDVLPKASIQHATPVSVEAVDRKPFLLTKSEKTGAAEMQELRQAADQVDALEVVRPLSLTERAVALALAVSLDNDYFSRHSQTGVGMPMPIPFYTSESAATEDSHPESSNAGSETGHEVFPSEGYQGSHDSNTGREGGTPDGTKDEMLADDPFFGMFDEPESGGQINDDQFFDDTPDSGDSWGSSDWGIGDSES